VDLGLFGGLRQVQALFSQQTPINDQFPSSACRQKRGTVNLRVISREFRERSETLAQMKASADDESASSVSGAAGRELQPAGWKPEVGEGGTIWQSPEDGHWYDELRAISLLKEDADPGDSA
jgi:hypothetical protein